MSVEEVSLPIMSKKDAKHFFEQGYVVLRHVLTDDDLKKLEDRVIAQAPNQDLRDQYNQSSDSKRYEYSLSRNKPIEVLGKRKADEIGDASEPNSEREDRCEASGEVFQISTMTDIAQKLFPALQPAECFCIVSEPGSLDQPEHTDSIPDEDVQTVEEWQSTLSYIGLLTPLRDTNVTRGRTGLIPGSHVNALATEEIQLSLGRGDVLVLDGRTVHRGLANTSDASEPPRKICFFTYTLPDVTDGNAKAYDEPKC